MGRPMDARRQPTSSRPGASWVGGKELTSSELFLGIITLIIPVVVKWVFSPTQTESPQTVVFVFISQFAILSIAVTVFHSRRYSSTATQVTQQKSESFNGQESSQ